MEITRKEKIIKEQIKARLGLIREHKDKENLLNVVLSFLNDLEQETGKSYYLTIREFKIRK
jgi:hypothetical protein